MRSWWPSDANVQLGLELAARFPFDDRNDGLIGDKAHQKRKSDHNADPRTGVVRARDIQIPTRPDSADLLVELAEDLRAVAAYRHYRALTNLPLKYLIHRGRIATCYAKVVKGRRIKPWTWRDYTGSNPHLYHIHASFTPAGDRWRGEFGVAEAGRPSAASVALRRNSAPHTLTVQAQANVRHTRNRDAIRLVQEHALGIEADGLWGPMTNAHWTRYVEALPFDYPETLADSAFDLARPSHHRNRDGVRRVQAALQHQARHVPTPDGSRIPDPGPVDGWWGPRTNAAWKAHRALQQ